MTANKKDNFNRLIDDLKNIKEIVLNKRIKKVEEIVNKRSQKIRLSSFELMEHNFRENSHSNVLEYLFDYNMIGETGTRILYNFVKGIDSLDKKKKLTDIIHKKTYRLEREKYFKIDGKSGRMDLAIIDDKYKMMIVIENKVKDIIHMVDDETNQIELYRKYVEKIYKDYSKAYILLSYRDVEKNYSPFIYKDYNYLFSVLKSSKSDDHILKDYIHLLHNITRGINEKDVLRSIMVLKNGKIKSLNTLELIKEVCYGI